MEENKIVIYQTEDGQTQIDVRMENETVWLTQAQMAALFQTDRTSIVRHINNIYKEEELDRESTCAKNAQVQIEGNRQVVRIIPFFNLDMIISVGYRVNSKRGIKFRQWANRVLKQYLVKGYAVNERLRKEQIGELRQLVGMLGRTIQSQPLLSSDESNALFEVVADYTYALDTLDNYDYERLTIDKTTKEEPFHATYQQTHRRHALPVFPQWQRHPLPQRRLQAPGRQHPRRPDPDDCRKQNRGKGCNGEGCGKPD